MSNHVQTRTGSDAGITEGTRVDTEPRVVSEHAADTSSPDGGAAPARARRHDVASLEQEGEVAADYLEEFLDICDLDGDLDLDVEGDRAVVAIVGEGIAQLVGERGQVLDALQELTRLAVLAQTGQRSRLMLDVAGYRAERRIELTSLGSEAARLVLEKTEPRKLEPMNAFERKVVHDAVAAVDGVVSESKGEEPRRCVVILPSPR